MAKRVSDAVFTELLSATQLSVTPVPPDCSAPVVELVPKAVVAAAVVARDREQWRLRLLGAMTDELALIEELASQVAALKNQIADLRAQFLAAAPSGWTLSHLTDGDAVFSLVVRCAHGSFHQLNPSVTAIMRVDLITKVVATGTTEMLSMQEALCAQMAIRATTSQQGTPLVALQAYDYSRWRALWNEGRLQFVDTGDLTDPGVEDEE